RAALTEATILQWAEAHHRRTGAWPSPYGGTIQDAPGETWTAINAALKMGHRGRRRGSSLDRLLSKHRIQRRPRLTRAQVLEWAAILRNPPALAVSEFRSNSRCTGCHVGIGGPRPRWRRLPVAENRSRADSPGELAELSLKTQLVTMMTASRSGGMADAAD